MNDSTTHHASLTILSPRALKVIHTEIVEGLLKAHLEKRHLYVTVRGELGKVVVPDFAKDQLHKPGFDFTYYQTPLTDEDATVDVDLKRSLYEEQSLKEGSYVEVQGRITANVYKGAKSTVSFRLEAISIKRVESPAEIKERERKADVIKFLRATPRASLSFPSAPLRISVIHSKSTEAGVDEDFRKALGPYAASIVESLPVSIISGRQIAEAIKQATGNVLVLIRGGGEASDFDVFSTRLVLEALANKKGVYRITGIGHAKTATVADWMVEHSAVTPTDAGSFLRAQLEHAAQRDKEAQHQQRNLTEHMSKVRAQDTEIGGLKQALSHTTALLDQAKAKADQLHRQHHRLRMNVVIYAIAVVVGMAVLIWLWF